MRALPKILAIALVLLLPLLSTPVGAGVVGKAVRTDGQSFIVEMNEGQMLRFDRDVTSVFIANPEIADITVRSSTLVYLFGKKPGETSLFAVDANENIIANTRVIVRHNISRLQSSLDQLVAARTVKAASIDGGIILSGEVETATESEDARRMALRFIGEGEDVINRLAVTAPNQINLRVRIAEVSREIINQFGLNWSALYNGGFDIGITSTPGANSLANFATIAGNIGALDLNILIDALADDGLVSVLAEPNLTAVSGETASFLAGGEFPIPVAEDDDRITIVFKNFGVSLAFTPTLIGKNRISMRVRPEVSQLSTAAAVTFNTISIPSLTTRRADTTVELGSGQSFAIAGLILDNTRHDASKFPGLGDIPVLGRLFQSDRFERNETELVIIVTPYIVEPVSGKELQDPTMPFGAISGNTQQPAGDAATVAARPQTFPVQGLGTAQGPNAVGFIVE